MIIPQPDEVVNRFFGFFSNYCFVSLNFFDFLLFSRFFKMMIFTFEVQKTADLQSSAVFACLLRKIKLIVVTVGTALGIALSGGITVGAFCFA